MVRIHVLIAHQFGVATLPLAHSVPEAEDAVVSRFGAQSAAESRNLVEPAPCLQSGGGLKREI
jgi:hypothetical protein